MQDVLIEKRKSPTTKARLPPFSVFLLAASPAQSLPGQLGTGAPLPVAPYLTGRAPTVLQNTSTSPLSPQWSARLAGASLEGFGRPAAEKAKQSSGMLSTLAAAALGPPFHSEKQQQESRQKKPQ